MLWLVLLFDERLTNVRNYLLAVMEEEAHEEGGFRSFGAAWEILCDEKSLIAHRSYFAKLEIPQ